MADPLDQQCIDLKHHPSNPTWADRDRFVLSWPGTYNRDGHGVIDHRTWVIVSDGDLMGRVASGAASLAGHLKLGRLICLYDDNEVTLAAGADIAFTEDRGR